tara:strand:- start:1094 stop:1216 length:123 start_codon:yes stop_codon:yes gene_type:complete
VVVEAAVAVSRYMRLVEVAVLELIVSQRLLEQIYLQALTR